MSEFIKVTTKSEIPQSSIKEFEVNKVMVAIANLNGEFFAIENTCTHDGGPLGEGEVVDGCCVECPRHGAKFDLKTGGVMSLPATMPVASYEVKVEGEDIFVKI